MADKSIFTEADSDEDDMPTVVGAILGYRSQLVDHALLSRLQSDGSSIARGMHVRMHKSTYAHYNHHAQRYFPKTGTSFPIESPYNKKKTTKYAHLLQYFYQTFLLIITIIFKTYFNCYVL